MAWHYGRKNSIKDRDLRDVIQSLEQFFANPHFPRMRLDKPGGRTLSGDRVISPVQVEFDADSVLDTPLESITETHISDDAISTPKLQANAVTAAKLAAINLEVGKYIRSTSYTPGVEGWAIDANGDAEFNSVIVRGVLDAIGTDGRRILVEPDGGSGGGEPTIYFFTGSDAEAQPGMFAVQAIDADPYFWGALRLIGPIPENGSAAVVQFNALDQNGDQWSTMQIGADALDIASSNGGDIDGETIVGWRNVNTGVLHGIWIDNNSIDIGHLLGTTPEVTAINVRASATNSYNLLAAPRGVVGVATATSSQGSITSTVDLTGLSVTFTSPGNRRYRIMAQANLQSSAAGDTLEIDIALANGTWLQRAFDQSTAVNQSVTLNAAAVHAPSAGSVTYKVQARRANGTGTLSTFASAQTPAFILVEDIGAA